MHLLLWLFVAGVTRRPAQIAWAMMESARHVKPKNDRGSDETSAQGFARLTRGILESMATVTEIGSLISRRPDIRGGRPCIAGTGVSVRRIAQWYNMGLVPEEIARKFGHLSLAQIHAALAYYHANQADIDADLEAEARRPTPWNNGAGAELHA